MNDTFAELVRKKNRYRRCGTREVWIISQEPQEVSIYTDHGNHMLKEQDELWTDLIPSFSTSVAKLFSDETD